MGGNVDHNQAVFEMTSSCAFVIDISHKSCPFVLLDFAVACIFSIFFVVSLQRRRCVPWSNVTSFVSPTPVTAALSGANQSLGRMF